MNLEEAKSWIASRAVIEQGYYLDGDDGQPNPTIVYCRKHAAAMAQRLTCDTRKTAFCEAWGGSDTVERCGIKSCDVTLDTGGLTEEGVRWALGMDEQNAMSFVADINELELARRAMTGGTLRSQYYWQLWLSQVLRHQRGVTRAQCLAFEAAWLAEHWDLALGILCRRNTKHTKRARKTRARRVA